MIRLYRAISQSEKNDYDIDQQFRTGKNTLEAKQFFKSRIAVNEFVKSSVSQQYNPIYVHILTITIDDDLFNEANPTNMELDGFDAVNINEDDLVAFNNCVKFVKAEAL